MAHELEIVNGEARMFYIGEAPWHGLGKKFQDVLTWEQAVVESGADWEVELQPLFRRRMTGQRMGVKGDVPIEKFDPVTLGHFTVRKSDDKILGVVGPDYTVVQNRDAFRFIDDLTDDSRPKYETGGVLRGGRKTWVLARMPKEIVIAGDEIASYILAVNGHDGTHSLMAMVTPTRVVCMNTLRMAIMGARSIWKTNHVGDRPEQRIQAARDVLGLSFKYLDSFESLANQLCSFTLTDEELKEMAAYVFPAHKQDEISKTEALRRESLEILVRTDPQMAGFHGTGWAAVNAAAAINDHGMRTKNHDRNLERAWMDTSVKDRALEWIRDNKKTELSANR